jgi:hypothetical protein
MAALTVAIEVDDIQRLIEPEDFLLHYSPLAEALTLSPGRAWHNPSTSGTNNTPASLGHIRSLQCATIWIMLLRIAKTKPVPVRQVL